MKKSITTVLLFAAYLFGAQQAQAASMPEAQTLEPVVVTAGRIAENPKTVTQSVTVIPREEIKKNQYQDLGGMLRNYGIQIDSTSLNEAFPHIAIRGILSSSLINDFKSPVLILVDGRRVGTENLSVIPMANIERIEILRGPAAVQYGTSAIGGVVNIVTKRGREQLELSAEAGYGSWDTRRAQGGVSGMLGPVDFSGGISWLTAGSYQTASGGTYRNTDVDSKLTYSLNLGLNFLDEHRLGFKLMGVEYNEMGMPGDIKEMDGGAFSDRYNYSFDVDYQGGCKDFGLSWMSRYYNGRDWYRANDREISAAWYPFKYFTDYQGAQGQVSFNKSFLTLTGGVDWLQYDSKSSNIDFQAFERSKYTNLGAFLLTKLNFFDDFVILSGGLRHDNYNLKAGGNTRNLSHTTPSVGIALNPLDWLTLRANYGESYRIPTAEEALDRTYSFGGLPTTYVGNPNLKPEKGKTWDAGFEVNHKSLHLGLTYFQTTYTNTINARYIPGTFDKEYYNAEGTEKYRGIEAQASVDLGSFFDWPFMLRPYANLTHMLKFKDGDGNIKEHASRNNLAYGLQFAHPDYGLNTDLRITYYGKQHVTYYDPTNWFAPPMRTTIGKKTVVDLFVTKAVWDGGEKGKLSVKGELRNMFNERYELTAGYPMPGMSFFIGLRYDY